MEFAVSRVAVNRVTERLGYLTGRPTEFDRSASIRNPFHGETLVTQPSRNRLQLCRSWTELLSELHGGEPSMVRRRGWILLITQELFECRLPLRAARENQLQALEAEVRCHGAGVLSRLNRPMRGPRKQCPGVFIDGARDSRGRLRKKRRCKQKNSQYGLKYAHMQMDLLCHACPML